jgi:hypothetical protein
MRLAALALLAAAVAAVPPAAEAAGRHGRWRFAEERDEVTGEPIGMLTLPADDGRFELVVACESHEIMVIVDWTEKLSSEDLDVTERLGKGDPLDRRWEMAEDHHTLVHPERGAALLQILEEMEAAGTLRLAVTPDDQKQPLRARFDMDGLAALLPKLRGCTQ